MDKLSWMVPLMLFVGGNLLASALLFKFLIFPTAFESEIYSQLVLSPPKTGEDPSVAFDLFVRFCILLPIAFSHNPDSRKLPFAFQEEQLAYSKFMFFNVTNQEEMKSGAKPIVDEIGPYVYKLVRKRKHITEVDRDLLQYANYDEYHFDSQKTYESGCRIEGLPCTLEDKINTINPFLMIIGGLLSELPDELTLK